MGIISRITSLIRRFWKLIVAISFVFLLIGAGVGYAYYRIKALETKVKSLQIEPKEKENPEEKPQEEPQEEFEEESEEPYEEQRRREEEQRRQEERVELEEYAISLLQEITCTMPIKANVNWAVQKLEEGWNSLDFYNFLRQTPEFQQRYPGIPNDMSCQDYDNLFNQVNLRWMQRRGRPLTREEFGRMGRGEYIPLNE